MKPSSAARSRRTWAFSGGWKHRARRSAAAVAVCIVTRQNVPAWLITRRAPTLRNHAASGPCPAGRRDPGESAEDAALRELREETGVQVAPDAVLGVLDDYVTRSGYLMTPVVVGRAGQARG